MKYQTEFRDGGKVKAIATQIRQITTKPWRIMEVCGGQTHSILKYGLDELAPREVEFLHGPGCPICVTPTKVIDQALELSKRENILFCSFGDMLRVPGSKEDLLSLKARGALIQMVYSPLDAVKLAGCLNELSAQSGRKIHLESSVIEISDAVSSACELLGLNPYALACEGRFVLFVKNGDRELILQTLGSAVSCIGHVGKPCNQATVIHTNQLGVERFMEPPLGDLLPRIC